MNCRLAISAAILAYSSAALGLIIDLGQFSLADSQTAHINVFNPGPGWVDVRLVFSDATGQGKTLVEHDERLQDGESTTLSLAGSAVPAGAQVRAKVLSLGAASGSTCEPDATLQIVTKGIKISAISRGAVRKVPLNANESAATHALRTIAQAQSQYFDGKRVRGETPQYALSFEELEQAGILPRGYGKDVEARVGYSFEFAIAPLIYSVVAREVNRTGDRSFFVDETGVTRATTRACAAPPASDSPPLNN